MIAQVGQKSGSVFGDGHIGQILTDDLIAMLPQNIYVADLGWYDVMGGQERFAQNWLPHFQVAAEELPPYGWLGATLFHDPVSLAKYNGTGPYFTGGAKIWWESEGHFKAALRSQEGTPLGDAWKKVVDDLQAERWKSLVKRRWDVALQPGMIIIAGDPLPPWPNTVAA